MKKSLLAACIVALFTASVFAQAPASKMKMKSDTSKMKMKKAPKMKMKSDTSKMKMKKMPKK